VRALLADVVSLTKPRLSAMVLFTCAGGAWLARTPLPWSFWLVTLVATAGTVGAANAFNCFIERRSDRFMVRTAGRPLPAERMEPGFALVFAIGLSLVSVPALFLGSGWLPGTLGLLALLSYVLAYTPLKSRTHWAMLVGAVPGALPPLMGWAAATGRISAPGLALFAILFVWQLPHFIAIALFRKDDYRNAGLTSLPLAHGDLVAWRCAVAYLVLMIPVSALPIVVGVASWVYGVPAMALGVLFLLSGLRGLLGQRSLRDARKLFGTSLLYLLLLFVALGFDRALH
jgi:protoheme IX farnesyltransferase